MIYHRLANSGMPRRTIALDHRPDVEVAPYQLPHRSSRQREACAAHSGRPRQVPDVRALARLLRDCFRTMWPHANASEVNASAMHDAEQSPCFEGYPSTAQHGNGKVRKLQRVDASIASCEATGTSSNSPLKVRPPLGGRVQCPASGHASAGNNGPATLVSHPGHQDERRAPCGSMTHPPHITSHMGACVTASIRLLSRQHGVSRLNYYNS